MTWRLTADNGEKRSFETRAEAESAMADLEDLGLNVSLSHVAVSDGGSVPMDDGEGETTTVPDTTSENDLPAAPDVTEDPLSWMPNHFVDTIKDTTAINRKGYAVLAEHYGVSVVAEPVTLPGETDFEYAAFRAVATTRDGQEYSGFGSAHVDREDGDDPMVLAEMAETRAMKRAIAWATGVGMTAVEEMKSATVEEGNR